jgi:hypothetical protein
VTQSNLQRSEQAEDDQEWIERVGKTAYNLAYNCVNDEYIVKSSDPDLLRRIELAIKQHLETMPSNLRPTFRQILDDIKARKRS